MLCVCVFAHGRTYLKDTRLFNWFPLVTTQKGLPLNPTPSKFNRVRFFITHFNILSPTFCLWNKILEVKFCTFLRVTCPVHLIPLNMLCVLLLFTLPSLVFNHLGLYPPAGSEGRNPRGFLAAPIGEDFHFAPNDRVIVKMMWYLVVETYRLKWNPNQCNDLIFPTYTRILFWI